MNTITNPYFGEQEGFGEQYKQIIYYMIYSELIGKKFVYTPLKEVAHNYENQPDWIQELENLMGLKKVLPRTTGPLGDQPFVADVLHYLHSNMSRVENSTSMQLVRDTFYRQNSKNPWEFGIEFVKRKNIVIHIRRQNSHDNNTHSGLMVPDEVYVQIISKLYQIYPDSCINIFSQGKSEIFKKFIDLVPQKILLHLNKSLKETFLKMVYADVLVIAPSALSYVAGLLTKNQVYYLRHCNPPLSSWSIIDGYISPRMYHKFGHLTTVYFDSERGEYIIFKDSFGFKPLQII